MPLKPDTLALTVVLALLTALGPLSTDMYLPSLPAIARELEASTARAQMTLSAFLFGFAGGQIVYGPVSDRVGRSPVLLFGLILFIAASVACALAPTVEALVGARFLQALGASGPIVLGRAIVRDLYEGAARREGIVAHGHDHGARAGARPDLRRRPRRAVRLAREFLGGDPVRRRPRRRRAARDAGDDRARARRNPSPSRRS